MYHALLVLVLNSEVSGETETRTVAAHSCTWSLFTCQSYVAIQGRNSKFSIEVHLAKSKSSRHGPDVDLDWPILNGLLAKLG
eukprot:6051153-Pleurochrysis_carterae.AAC.1